MKFLVTGGAGFIGSHVVEELVAAEHAVTVVDNFDDFYDPRIKRDNLAAVLPRITLIEEDIQDRDAMLAAVQTGGFDVIIHLAARAGVRPSIKRPQLYLDTNIQGTFNLLEAARSVGVPKFILASSSSVYGLSKTVPFSEDQCLTETISPYAATKLAAEQLCSNYAHLYGIRTVCLRFFTVYGPRQRPDLAIHKFTERIHSGRPIDQYGDGTTRRDYTYIDDIVQGVMASLAYEKEPFDVFNLGENETTRLKDLIAHLESALGREANINLLPEQPGDVPLTCADISKAKRLLGYNPATPITEGIPRFVEWFLGARAKSTAVGA
jgi:UDP-glucuronate 4-epimerase